MTFEVQNGIVQMSDQRHLHGERSDVEGEEIGDGEADHERASAQTMKQNFSGREIGLQDRAELGQLRRAALEGLDVAARP